MAAVQSTLDAIRGTAHDGHQEAAAEPVRALGFNRRDGPWVAAGEPAPGASPNPPNSGNYIYI